MAAEVLTKSKTLCRLCAKESDVTIGIFSDEGILKDLPNKINKYLPIHVSQTDALPQQSCCDCTAAILTWHNVVERCLIAERTLSELLMKDEHCEGYSNDGYSDDNYVSIKSNIIVKEVKPDIIQTSLRAYNKLTDGNHAASIERYSVDSGVIVVHEAAGDHHHHHTVLHKGGQQQHHHHQQHEVCEMHNVVDCTMCAKCDGGDDDDLVEEIEYRCNFCSTLYDSEEAMLKHLTTHAHEYAVYSSNAAEAAGSYHHHSVIDGSAAAQLLTATAVAPATVAATKTVTVKGNATAGGGSVDAVIDDVIAMAVGNASVDDAVELDFRCNFCDTLYDSEESLMDHINVHAHEYVVVQNAAAAASAAASTNNHHQHKIVAQDQHTTKILTVAQANAAVAAAQAAAQAAAVAEQQQQILVAEEDKHSGTTTTHILEATECITTYQCTQCSKHFESQNAYMCHTCTPDPAPATITATITTTVPTTTARTADVVLYACSQCDKRFRQQQSLTRHTRMCHQPQEPSESSRYSKVAGSVKLKRADAASAAAAAANAKHLCKLCGKAFKQARLLRNHYTSVHKLVESPK